MIDGVVKSINGNTITIHAEQDDTRYTVESSEPVNEGDQVSLAIRPEKILVEALNSGDNSASQAQPDSTENHFNGAISEMAYLGGTSTLRVTTESGRVFQITSTNQKRHLTGKHDLDWDDKVTISFSASNAILLKS